MLRSAQAQWEGGFVCQVPLSVPSHKSACLDDANGTGCTGVFSYFVYGSSGSSSGSSSDSSIFGGLTGFGSNPRHGMEAGIKYKLW